MAFDKNDPQYLEMSDAYRNSEPGIDLKPRHWEYYNEASTSKDVPYTEDEVQSIADDFDNQEFQRPKVAAREPTLKDAKFLFIILNCMKNVPDVDWHLVAKHAGLANDISARTRFGYIRGAIRRYYAYRTHHDSIVPVVLDPTPEDGKDNRSKGGKNNRPEGDKDHTPQGGKDNRPDGKESGPASNTKASKDVAAKGNGSNINATNVNKGKRAAGSNDASTGNTTKVIDVDGASSDTNSSKVVGRKRAAGRKVARNVNTSEDIDVDGAASDTDSSEGIAHKRAAGNGVARDYNTFEDGDVEGVKRKRKPVKFVGRKPDVIDQYTSKIVKDVRVHRKASKPISAWNVDPNRPSKFAQNRGQGYYMIRNNKTSSNMITQASERSDWDSEVEYQNDEILDLSTYHGMDEKNNTLTVSDQEDSDDEGDDKAESGQRDEALSTRESLMREIGV